MASSGSCKSIPDAVRCDYAINEGGGERLVLGDRPLYLCAVAEKMSAPFRLRVRGRSGHASQPNIADNALVKAARYVEALGAFDPEPQLIPEVERFLGLLLGDVPSAGDALARARQAHPLAAELVEPLLAATVSPTMIEASRKRNVIPATCEVTVDCRLLPGDTPEDVEPLLRAVLDGGTTSSSGSSKLGVRARRSTHPCGARSTSTCSRWNRVLASPR